MEQLSKVSLIISKSSLLMDVINELEILDYAKTTPKSPDCSFHFDIFLQTFSKCWNQQQECFQHCVAPKPFVWFVCLLSYWLVTQANFKTFAWITDKQLKSQVNQSNFKTLAWITGKQLKSQVNQSNLKKSHEPPGVNNGHNSTIKQASNQACRRRSQRIRRSCFVKATCNLTIPEGREGPYPIDTITGEAWIFEKYMSLIK